MPLQHGFEPQRLNVRTLTEGPLRSGSVARPIMQDSHSCDWGSNPHRSMLLLSMFKMRRIYFVSLNGCLVKSNKSRCGYLYLPSIIVENQLDDTNWFLPE